MFYLEHMAVDTEIIGRRIAEARDRAGLTQAELADRISPWLAPRWRRSSAAAAV